MALNTERLHPVKEMLMFNPIGSQKPATEKEKSVKRLKTFKADQPLCDDFDLYCEHIAKSSFTDAVTGFMVDTVAANRAEIERLREALKR